MNIRTNPQSSSARHQFAASSAAIVSMVSAVVDPNSPWACDLKARAHPQAAERRCSQIKINLIRRSNHSTPMRACFSATERFIIRTNRISTSVTTANIQKQSK